MASKDDKDEATIDLEAITNAGKRLKLKGRELDRYIHDHMTGFGYKSKRSYFKDEGDEDEGTPFWRRKNKSDDDEDDL